jgi:hypothetical protein
MIDTICQTSKISNRWIDTFSVSMIDSIDQYYWNRSFDYLITIKIVFLEEVGHFFIAMAKNVKNLANFLTV